MDVLGVMQSYILKLLEEAGPGMKVLLLDGETTPGVSLAFAQSALMRQEVFLFERLRPNVVWEDMRYLKCICILRPDPATISQLCSELGRPRYQSYYVYFTNILPRAAVKQLAEADMQEVVKEVKEIYIDYLPFGSHLFGLSLANPLQPLGSRWVEEHLARTSQAVASVLLSNKLCPAIRYQEGSGPASLLANSVRSVMARESEQFSGAADNAVLIILDRREDPVTPLLTQWTYQAMVHQLIGINNNRVSLAGVPGVNKDLQEILLSAAEDEFYAANLYSNFGEIGQTIKVLMEEYQRKAQSHQKIESIADMKNFVENYPQFKKMSGTVSKHVTLVSELSRLVGCRGLLEISELEQEIVSDGDHKEMLRKITELIQKDKTTLEDATRLSMLFALRFEQSNSSSVRTVLSLLRKKGGEREARLVQNLQRFAGQNVRKGNLFGDHEITTKNITGKLFKGLKGVENVYTQHSPLLKQILDDCVKNRLKTSAFPSLGPTNGKVNTIVAFVIGGFTYEEAFTVHQLNSTLGVQIILGGTSLINSKAFIEQIETSFPPSSSN